MVILTSSISTITAIIWILLIGSTVLEQQNNYLRVNPFTQEILHQVTWEQILDRKPDLQQYLVEIFNSEIRENDEQSEPENIIHSSRYIGVHNIPLLALLPFYSWKRKEKWLGVLALSILLICFTPPILLGIWSKLPFFNNIRHIFSFYTHYWKLLLSLLAVLVFDKVLLDNFSATENIHLKKISTFFLALIGLIFLAIWGMALVIPYGQINFENILLALSVTLICTIVLSQAIGKSVSHRKIFAVIIIIVAFSDLTTLTMSSFRSLVRQLT